MWTIILSFSVSGTLVMSLLFCLCWRKKTPKNEWLGLDGMVTQKNPDENVNHLPSAAPCVVDGFSASGDNLDLNKRNVVTNTRRSLPDIPSDQTAVNWEPNGDNSSEHYATVGQYENHGKRHTISNGDARPSISQHSSMSQADEFSPYERVKYDKIKSKKEHPYAQVQPNSRTLHEEQSNLLDETNNLLRVDGPGPSSEPTAPPRSRRSSANSSLGVDIPAASAVAGGIAASPELPYMTPPVTQSNFSGDSQDSSKGYTSITVREPLANIIAQTKEMNKKQREMDPHYATVSDDSDDVYTTIPDPNQIYTSESETYARIPALPITVEVEVNNCSSSYQESDSDKESITQQPAPPSVDSLKQVTGHTASHSRQASTSSSVANIGSPKPEKRQANSPLPPPPSGTSFDFHTEKVKNLDDLYAKVHKNKKDDNNEKYPENYDPANKSSANFNNIVEDVKPERRRREHNYETLKKSPRKTSDPDYEKIRNEEPGYASINGPESISSSDPGYEVLKNRTISESDPNYEELRHRVSNASDCAGYSRIKERPLDHGYSVVNKRGNTTKPPDYESMPSEFNSEPDYSTLKSNSSESDPNYESVSQNDPNYESVKDLEPPYERLDDDSSRTDSDVAAYEKIKSKNYDNNDTSESSNSAGKSLSDPPYEQLGNDTDSEIPGYERIQNNSFANTEDANRLVDESDKSNNIHDEDAIFQV